MNDKRDRDNKGRFVDGHKVTTKHGGEAATKAIQKGEPFSGLAAMTEAEVVADLADQGREALVNELATRLHTASRLYWNAIEMVADQARQGDETALRRFDGYVARFGWLAASTLRAWEQVRKEEGLRPDALDYDRIIKDIKDGQD